MQCCRAGARSKAPQLRGATFRRTTSPISHSQHGPTSLWFHSTPLKACGSRTFEWYDDSYDKLYQGIVGVTEIPDSDLVLVSVQRSSTLIIYDPNARRKVGEFSLSNGHGNPTLHFRGPGELWAADYDTLLKIEPGSWRVLESRRLQDAAAGTAQFIGEFAFNRDEAICAVARPFAGDVIGLDPKTFRTRYQAKIGGQPLEVAVLDDRRVYARDWKSGRLLQGSLRRT